MCVCVCEYIAHRHITIFIAPRSCGEKEGGVCERGGEGNDSLCSFMDRNCPKVSLSRRVESKLPPLPSKGEVSVVV